MWDTDRKQVVKDGKSHKLVEVTAANRHPREGRAELDGQVVTRQEQRESNPSPQQMLGFGGLS